MESGVETLPWFEHPRRTAKPDPSGCLLSVIVRSQDLPS